MRTSERWSASVRLRWFGGAVNVWGGRELSLAAWRKRYMDGVREEVKSVGVREGGQTEADDWPWPPAKEKKTDT